MQRNVADPCGARRHDHDAVRGSTGLQSAREHWRFRCRSHAQHIAARAAARLAMPIGHRRRASSPLAAACGMSLAAAPLPRMKPPLGRAEHDLGPRRGHILHNKAQGVSTEMEAGERAIAGERVGGKRLSHRLLHGQPKSRARGSCPVQPAAGRRERLVNQPKGRDGSRSIERQFVRSRAVR
jgi:hypothetical protein